jgi:hypothetical protein
VAGYREFQTGEVLTAANVNGFLMEQSIMTFADAAARDAALTAVLREGMLAYNLDTKALEVYDGTAWGPVVTAKEKRIEAFTGSGTWTVPAGVTYAIAHMLGGGGGAGGVSGAGSNGGSSSVAFSSGTVTAVGGQGGPAAVNNDPTDARTTGGQANSGRGTKCNGGFDLNEGQDAQWVRAAADVTPAASISVVVGAGGNTVSSGGNGGSGLVIIEYYEEV